QVLEWDAFCERSTNALRVRRWRLLKAWLSVCEGNPNEAIPSLKRLKDEFHEMGAQRDVALCCEYLGDAFGLVGDDSAALNSYAEAIEWGRRVSAVADVVLESLRKSGEAHARLGKYLLALRATKNALRLSKTYIEPTERAGLLRLRGMLKVQRGRIKAGLLLIEKSWVLFSEVGALLEAAVTAGVLEHHHQLQRNHKEAANWTRRIGEQRPASILLLIPKSSEPKRGPKKEPLERA